MLNYHDPDLTGMNPSYHVANEYRYIIKLDQRIKFKQPVFKNSQLQLAIVGEGARPLIEGTDYVIYDADIDYDSMSIMKNIDPEFNKTLISSLVIVVPFIDDYKISISYNTLFPEKVTYAYMHGEEEIDPSPELMASIVDRLNYFDAIIRNKDSVFTSQSDEIKLLNEDRSGSNHFNLITNEKHTIDIDNGIVLIQPKYGAFFGDSVVVKKPSGQILLENVDYKKIGYDLVKTELSSNTSGVFNYIKIVNKNLTPKSGDYTITYQAYGGELSISNARDLAQNVITLVDFLKNTPILTPNELRSNSTIQSIFSKLYELEDNMRQLLNSGIPTYGDISDGTSMNKKVISTDHLNHWWTIASLYKVDGSNDIVTADTMRLRFQLSSYDIQFELIASFNYLNDDNPFTVNCVIANMRNNTFFKINPKIRVIYNNDAINFSGALLQIGFRIDETIAYEIIGVEDLSGKESCWKLVQPTTANSVPPEDDMVTLPNNTMYNTAGGSSISIEQNINDPNGCNFLTIDSVDIAEGSNSISSKIVDPLYYISVKDVNRIKSICLVIYESENDKTYNIIVPVFIENSIKGSKSVVINGNSYLFEIEQYINGNNQYSNTGINLTKTSGSNINTFELREYLANF